MRFKLDENLPYRAAGTFAEAGCRPVPGPPLPPAQTASRVCTAKLRITRTGVPDSDSAEQAIALDRHVGPSVAGGRTCVRMWPPVAWRSSPEMCRLRVHCQGPTSQGQHGWRSGRHVLLGDGESCLN